MPHLDRMLYDRLLVATTSRHDHHPPYAIAGAVLLWLGLLWYPFWWLLHFRAYWTLDKIRRHPPNRTSSVNTKPLESMTRVAARMKCARAGPVTAIICGVALLITAVLTR